MIDLTDKTSGHRHPTGIGCVAVALMCGLLFGAQSVSAATGQKLLSAPPISVSTVNMADLPNSAPAPGRQPFSPSPDTNFPALLDNNAFTPPSIAAAVGTNRLMVALNSELSVQDKGGTPLFTTTLSNFWAGQIGVNGRVLNPRLAYDPSNDRWIFTACANPQTPSSSLLMAISATSDPAGTWFRYQVFIDPTNNVTWGSDNNLGFNDDWIVVTKNLRFTGGNTFNRTRLYVFDKAQLYQPLPVNNILSTNVLRTVIEDFTVSALVPAVSYDSSPGQMFLMANGVGNDGFGNGNLRLFRLTESTNLFSLAEIARPVSNSPWSDVPNTGTTDFLPQLDSAALIAAGDSRVQNLVLRNGSLWCAQTVFLPAGDGARAAAQWWQINLSGTVEQFGRVDDANGVRHFAYPSIAVNRDEDVLVGYSSFSITNYPTASYSFRFSTDPLNTLRVEEKYRFGDSPYLKIDPITGLNAWGNYSATVVDPLNDLDLWTVQEFASFPVGGVDRWGTWWAQVDLSTPPDGNLEVVIDPRPGSLIPAGVAQIFTARVFDTLAVTNATVELVSPNLPTPVSFQNNGIAPDLMADDNVYTAAVNLPPTSTSMQAIFTVRAPGKNDLTFTNIYVVAPPPGNDFFTAAFKIPERLPETNGVVIGGNFFASLEANEPVHAGVAARGNSVWWNWSPALSGPVLIDSLGSGFNTVLAVYTNNTITSLAEVTSANDVTNEFGQFVRDKAFVKFSAIAGHTYRIAVSGATTNEFGNIRLRMAFNGDQDVTRPVIAVTNLTSGALSRTNPPSGLIVNQPVLSLSGTASDPDPDSSGVRLVQIVGNDGILVNAVGTNNWTSTVSLQPGSNLLQIAAFDTAENRSEVLQFAVTLRAFNPVNDIFANAAPLTNFPGFVTFNNVNATEEGNEPRHAGKIGGKSVWFSFVPAANGVLSLSTTNSTIDTVLSLYSGTRLNELAVVSANDDAGPNLVHSEVVSGVVAGQEYRIAVDGLDGAAGTIQLHYSFQISDVFSLTVNTTQGGVVIPGSGVYAANAPVVLTALTNSGFDFVSWTGGVFSVDNPLNFNIRSNTTVTAVYGRRPITDDFEGGAFNTSVGWTQGGSASWSVQAADATVTNTVFGGAFFARSGAVSHNQTSELQITRGMRAGAAGFSYKLSTETGFDFLEFHLNGAVLLRDSGVSDWKNFRFNAPAGSNTVRWVYRRDEANGGGLNAAFIDNVDLPLLSAVDTNILISLNTNAMRFAPGSTNAFTIVPVQMGNSTVYGFFSNSVFIEVSTNQAPSFTTTNVVIRQFQIRVEGQTNQLYRIQATDDLGNWVTLQTNYAPFGVIQFTDQQSTNHQRRFYRAVTVE